MLAERGLRQAMKDNTPPFRWYRPSFSAAVVTELAPGLTLRHLDALYFLATKFEAYND